MTDMFIRPFRPGDGPALSEVFFRSVREAGRADYSRQQVQAWLPEPPSPDWFDRRARDGRSILVATTEDGHVVAYMDLEPDGHIDHAYCLPEFIGRGVASRLYDAIEAHAIGTGLGTLYVEASEAARRMFLRKQFEVTRRHDFVRNGVEIYNFDMRKHLTQSEDEFAPGDFTVG